jgi:hypothetical protein
MFYFANLDAGVSSWCGVTLGCTGNWRRKTMGKTASSVAAVKTHSSREEEEEEEEEGSMPMEEAGRSMPMEEGSMHRDTQWRFQREIHS